ncbi:tRNA epoxyqueuosine(34) reductase QueG [Alkaliphilus transvaalensis]|uniref:tRNA epoxyqueuosine(34) reductase QueG n=1 Tax=Alkaliphilus transvaalensis TaxID=114628 RepID=UPI000687D257|nr:tRNA epoxyqueuosine(34) reductase QueG [Alkaliphilus transvaalensis]
MDLKIKTKTFANELGIDLIGFTTAEPFKDLESILLRRKELEYLSGFEEKELELRIDPRKTLQTAKSIIVIGQSYYTDESELSNHLQGNRPKYYGELARTAWGKDYHLVLQEKLRALGDFLESQVEGFQYKAFVDTGPLVDRHVAYRAGLGWYGHNSTLINEKYGSWFFIGYMITNQEFEPDQPMDNQCLGCNLCIKNCPAGAIEEGFLLNTNKCLSCQLQKKGNIPEEVRGKLGKSLYGCDICQLVCPHNKGVKNTAVREFIPSDSSHLIDLVALLDMSNKEFKVLFQENASGWRGKKVLQRNAIIALVNQGDTEAIKYLQPLLKDPRPEIREYAEWGIRVLIEKNHFPVEE